MQDVLKQKNKVKKPKTFGAVNNAYEIYHLVHKAITGNSESVTSPLSSIVPIAVTESRPIDFTYKVWKRIA
jgi:hypothetical protein